MSCNNDDIIINSVTPNVECIEIKNISNNSDCIKISNAPITFVISVNGKTGVVYLDRNDVGLGNVDNTSDLDKPLSNASISALLLKTDLSSFLTLNSFITSNSGSWDSVYTTVQSNSAGWTYSIENNIDVGVRSLTGFWDSTYTTVSSNSGGWQNAALFVERGIIDCGFF
jgi:hypothetical protein